MTEDILTHVYFVVRSQWRCERCLEFCQLHSEADACDASVAGAAVRLEQVDAHMQRIQQAVKDHQAACTAGHNTKAN